MSHHILQPTGSNGRRALGTVALLAALLSLVSLPPPSSAVRPAAAAGSYTTVLPAGRAGPPTTIYRTPAVTGAMPTNDWWTSLAWKRYAGNHSEAMFAHPLAVRARAAGLGLGYTREATITPDGRKYEYPYREDLTAGVTGLNAAPADVRVDGYSDWTVTADWSGGALKATFGHGLPFVYFLAAPDATAAITFRAAPVVLASGGGALHVTLNGIAYGIFGPSSAGAWSVAGNRATLPLAGRGYFSVAALPDSSPQTFADFRAHAFAFVTSTAVTWSYNEAAGRMTATYAVTTSPKEGAETRPLLALYRHQWLYSTAVNTGYIYQSPRGEMKVVRGASFTTAIPFNGVLPWLPETGALDRAKLYDYVDTLYRAGNQVTGPGGAGDTYWTGKAPNRVAQLVPLADQAGHAVARDAFLADLKTELNDWFTASPGETARIFYYDALWGTLIGYPASYESDTKLNDHHFHYGYFVLAAATIATYDPAWADTWGGMVELLIKDVANWSTREDSRFPRLRAYDPYAGHGWASGAQEFASGNNQESSSESLAMSTAMLLWGSVRGNSTIRDLGIYLYTNEVAAVEQYWFDVDQAVFPPAFGHDVIGIVWGDGASYSTWWTANPEEIHGINVLPVTGGSLYLGRRPDAIARGYAELLANNGGPEREWVDIIWSYLALSDPATALTRFSNNAYTPESGETTAHTYHWLTSLNALGRLETGVWATNNPTSAVFTRSGQRTYVAFNPTATPRTVTYSDGASLLVPPRALAASGAVQPTPTLTPTPTPTTTPTPTPAPTPSPHPTLDANGDGTVNSTDSLCVLRQIGDLAATPACPRPLPHPDVNVDGAVNSVDALCILRYLGGFARVTACPYHPA